MEKKTGLSIANMLSVIGLIGLGLGTAMGIVLEGKEVAIAIGCGAGVFILGILGLFLAVRQKRLKVNLANGVNMNISDWRCV